MFALIALLALIGVGVTLVMRSGMAEPFKLLIYVVAAICTVALLLRAFGIADVPVPQL